MFWGPAIIETEEWGLKSLRGALGHNEGEVNTEFIEVMRDQVKCSGGIVST